jgi:hypothetical protein
MKHYTDSWKAHTGHWRVSVSVSGAPMSIDEAKELLRDLQKEIDRAERDDSDGSEA